ncbi:MAG: hypothetical protein RSE41_00450 [Clostridia bacterium]
MTKVENLIKFLSVNTIEDEFNIYNTDNFLSSDDIHYIYENEDDKFNVLHSVIKSVDVEDPWYVIEFIVKYEDRIFGFTYSVTEQDCFFRNYVEYEYYVPASFKVK